MARVSGRRCATVLVTALLVCGVVGPLGQRVVSGSPSVAAGLSPIAVGDQAACIIVAGDVRCWGRGLGAGASSSASAVTVPGLSGVVAVSVGLGSACALTNTGDVSCWGGNSDGELGDGNFVDSLTPVHTMANAVAISVGTWHACALSNVGGVLCWGSDYTGELGDGHPGTKSATPVNVSGLASGATSIAAGENHSCAVVGGEVKCWGANGNGQLGDGTTIEHPTPTAVPFPQQATQVVAGEDYSCALTVIGAVLCWGSNVSGQLGDSSTTDSATPQYAVVSDAVALSAGLHHACAVENPGLITCWGATTPANLATARPSTRIVPTGSQHPLGRGAVSAGDAMTCAVGELVRCWGDGSLIGDPEVLTAPSLDNATVSLGASHACALTSAAALKCWAAELVRPARRRHDDIAPGSRTGAGTSECPGRVRG